MKINITILLVLLFAKLMAQNENQLAKEMRKRNNINEKYTYSFNIKNGDSLLLDTDLYDKLGNQLKSFSYNEKGQVTYNYILEYNEDSLMIKQVGYNELNTVSTTLVYEYDKRGNQIMYKQLDPKDKILNQQKRTYNKQGQNIELFNYDEESRKFYLKAKYFYREDGQWEKIEKYSKGGQIVATSEYEYDKSGNMITSYELDKSGKKLIASFKYNIRNEMVERFYPKKIEKIVDGKIQTKEIKKRIVYEYDSEGNLIEEKTLEDDILIKREKYYYKKFNL